MVRRCAAVLSLLGGLWIAACSSSSIAAPPAPPDSGAGVDAGEVTDASAGPDTSDANFGLANCRGEVGGCARAQLSMALSCEDTSTVPSTKWTTFASLTTNDTVSECRVLREGADTDLVIQVGPKAGDPRPDHLYFRLRKFTGPGVYKVIDEPDIFRFNTGLTLRGKGAANDPNAPYTGRASACTNGCSAGVSGPPLLLVGTYAEYIIDIVCPGGFSEQGSPACTTGIKCTEGTPTRMRVDIGCPL